MVRAGLEGCCHSVLHEATGPAQGILQRKSRVGRLRQGQRQKAAQLSKKKHALLFLGYNMLQHVTTCNPFRSHMIYMFLQIHVWNMYMWDCD
jgi:hypothetical protein